MKPDDDLQALFSEMRAEDSAETPSFPRMFHPATFRHHAAGTTAGFPLVRLVLAASGALVLAVGAVLFVGRSPEQEVDTASWSNVSNWSASTDSLLSGSQNFSTSTFTAPSDSWLKGLNSTTKKASENDQNL